MPSNKYTTDLEVKYQVLRKENKNLSNELGLAEKRSSVAEAALKLSQEKYVEADGRAKRAETRAADLVKRAEGLQAQILAERRESSKQLEESKRKALAAEFELARTTSRLRENDETIEGLKANLGELTKRFKHIEDRQFAAHQSARSLGQSQEAEPRSEAPSSSLAGELADALADAPADTEPAPVQFGEEKNFEFTFKPTSAPTMKSIRNEYESLFRLCDPPYGQPDFRRNRWDAQFDGNRAMMDRTVGGIPEQLRERWSKRPGTDLHPDISKDWVSRNYPLAGPYDAKQAIAMFPAEREERLKLFWENKVLVENLSAKKVKVTELEQKVKEDIQSVEEKAKSDIQSVEEKAKSDIQSAEEKAKADIQSVEKKTKADIQSVEEKAKTEIQSAKDKAQEHIRSAEEKAQEEIRSADEKAKAVVQAMEAKVKIDIQIVEEKAKIDVHAAEEMAKMAKMDVHAAEQKRATEVAKMRKLLSAPCTRLHVLTWPFILFLLTLIALFWYAGWSEAEQKLWLTANEGARLATLGHFGYGGRHTSRLLISAPQTLYVGGGLNGATWMHPWFSLPGSASWIHHLFRSGSDLIIHVLSGALIIFGTIFGLR